MVKTITMMNANIRNMMLDKSGRSCMIFLYARNKMIRKPDEMTTGFELGKRENVF